MESRETVILAAIRAFPFYDYGMDDVEEIKDEEWSAHLAARISDALRSAG